MQVDWKSYKLVQTKKENILDGLSEHVSSKQSSLRQQGGTKIFGEACETIGIFHSTIYCPPLR